MVSSSALPLDSIFGIIVMRAATGDRLPAATRASLDIAAGNVELSFHDAAIVARPLVRAPIIFFLAIADSSELLAADRVGFLLMGFVDFLSPSFRHLNAVVDDHFFDHERTSILQEPRNELTTHLHEPIAQLPALRA
jgi:hypothetical protein